MKTLPIPFLLMLANQLHAQGDVAVRLWAETRRTGHVQQSFDIPGPVDELRIDLQGEVSSLEIADGYVVTLFDGEDLASVHQLVISGPCIVDDLRYQPMNSLKGNWDGAVSSLLIARSSPLPALLPVLAALDEP